MTRSKLDDLLYIIQIIDDFYNFTMSYKYSRHTETNRCNNFIINSPGIFSNLCSANIFITLSSNECNFRTKRDFTRKMNHELIHCYSPYNRYSLPSTSTSNPCNLLSQPSAYPIATVAIHSSVFVR